jgi:hypothetical protein
MRLGAFLLAFLTAAGPSIEWRNGGDFLSRFTVADSPFQSTMTRRLGVLAGVVYDRDGHPHDVSGGIATERPECLSPAFPAEAHTAAMSARRRAITRDTVIIDLMELYTFDAENAAGGRANIEAKIAAAVDVLNTTILQSGISDVTFRLVHAGPIECQENRKPVELLIWLSNDSEVARLRQEHGADLVGLWTGAAAQIAWVPRSFTPASGFHVISQRYPLSLQLFTHEIGHNLGAQHNAEQTASQTNDPYPFAHGVRTDRWMTVMSYPPDGEWLETLPLFSNPAISYQGIPTGIADRADNARMIRVAALLVAEYRSRP